MTKFLILFLVFLCSPAFANPLYLLAGASGGGAPGPTYLLEENFEGTGYEVAGWVENLNHGSSIIDEDYTPALRGSQSLRVYEGSAAGTNTYHSYTATAEIWGHAIIQFPNYVGGASILPIVIHDIPSTSVAYIRYNNGLLGACNSAGTCTNGTTNVSNTTKHVWWRYKKGTGSDGIIQVWVGDTTTRPGTVEAQRTNLPATTDAAGIALSGQQTYSMIFDQLIISASELTSVTP